MNGDSHIEAEPPSRVYFEILQTSHEGEISIFLSLYGTNAEKKPRAKNKVLNHNENTDW